MKKILEYMGVESSAELASYHYYHGNNPEFIIVKKTDIRKFDCSMRDWQFQGGYRWTTVDVARELQESEDFHVACDKMEINFYKAMEFAMTLDDAWEYAQRFEVPFVKMKKNE